MKILCIVGPSGSGKSLVEETLLVHFPAVYSRTISTTTRPPRPGERNGVDYNFITQAEVATTDFLEFNIFKGHTYGTTIKSFDKKKVNIVVIEPNGLLALNKQFKNPIENRVSVLYLDIPDETRKEFLTRRDGNTDRLEDGIKELYNTVCRTNPGCNPGIRITEPLTHEEIMELPFQFGHPNDC